MVKIIIKCQDEKFVKFYDKKIVQKSKMNEKYTLYMYEEILGNL